MNRTGAVTGRLIDAVGAGAYRPGPANRSAGLVRLEIIAGLLVLAAIIVISLSIMNAGDRQVADGSSFYTLQARFDNIGDLRVDSRVAASGVTVGRVSSIDYDNETYEAIVGLSINRKYDRFPLDTAASVLTPGFTGDQFVELQPGADIVMLKDGDIIHLTQSALILEQVIGQFIYNQSRDDAYREDPFQAPEFGEQLPVDEAFVSEQQETGEKDE